MQRAKRLYQETGRAARFFSGRELTRVFRVFSPVVKSVPGHFRWQNSAAARSCRDMFHQGLPRQTYVDDSSMAIGPGGTLLRVIEYSARAFSDAFDQVLAAGEEATIPWSKTGLRLLGLWKESNG